MVLVAGMSIPEGFQGLEAWMQVIQGVPPLALVLVLGPDPAVKARPASPTPHPVARRLRVLAQVPSREARERRRAHHCLPKVCAPVTCDCRSEAGALSHPATHLVRVAAAGLATFQANMSVSHAMLQQQLAVLRENIRRVRLRTATAVNRDAALSNYQYSTRAGTKEYIAQHRPRVLTMEEALRVVRGGGSVEGGAVSSR